MMFCSLLTTQFYFGVSKTRQNQDQSREVGFVNSCAAAILSLKICQFFSDSMAAV